jgi:hypothetical protein
MSGPTSLSCASPSPLLGPQTPMCAPDLGTLAQHGVASGLMVRRETST